MRGSARISVVSGFSRPRLAQRLRSGLVDCGFADSGGDSRAAHLIQIQFAIRNPQSAMTGRAREDAPLTAATLRCAPLERLRRRLPGAHQTAAELSRRRDQRSGLLPRLDRRHRHRLDGGSGRGHRARRRRRGGPESAVRAGHRRLDAPYPDAPAAGRPRHASGRARLRPCAVGRRSGAACRARQLAVGRPRVRHAAHLSRDLHADEAAHAVVHHRRRGAGRAAGPDRLDGVARRNRSQRCGAVRDRVLLAAAALHGDRVAVPRGLRQSRVPDAAGDRPRRQAGRQAGGLLGAADGAREPRAELQRSCRQCVSGGRAGVRRGDCSGSPCGSPPRETKRPPARCSTDRSPICRCSGSR